MPSVDPTPALNNTDCCTPCGTDTPPLPTEAATTQPDPNAIALATAVAPCASDCDHAMPTVSWLFLRALTAVKVAC